MGWFHISWKNQISKTITALHLKFYSIFNLFCKSCWFVLAKGHSSPRHGTRKGDCRVSIHQSPSMCNPNLNTRPCVLVILKPNLTHLPLVPHICVGESGHLFGATPLSKPMLVHCQFDHQEQTSVNFNPNTSIFIHTNVSEATTCEMAADLARGLGVTDSACDKDSFLRCMLNHRFIIQLEDKSMFAKYLAVYDGKT